MMLCFFFFSKLLGESTLYFSPLGSDLELANTNYAVESITAKKRGIWFIPAKDVDVSAVVFYFTLPEGISVVSFIADANQLLSEGVLAESSNFTGTDPVPESPIAMEFTFDPVYSLTAGEPYIVGFKLSEASTSVLSYTLTISDYNAYLGAKYSASADQAIWEETHGEVIWATDIESGEFLDDSDLHRNDELILAVYLKVQDAVGEPIEPCPKDDTNINVYYPQDESDAPTCIFPFLSKGELAFECVSDGGMSWCATEVSLDFEILSSGWCDGCCASSNGFPPLLEGQEASLPCSMSESEDFNVSSADFITINHGSTQCEALPPYRTVDNINLCALFAVEYGVFVEVSLSVYPPGCTLSTSTSGHQMVTFNTNDEPSDDANDGELVCYRGSNFDDISWTTRLCISTDLDPSYSETGCGMPTLLPTAHPVTQSPSTAPTFGPTLGPTKKPTSTPTGPPTPVTCTSNDLMVFEGVSVEDFPCSCCESEPVNATCSNALTTVGWQTMECNFGSNTDGEYAYTFNQWVLPTPPEGIGDCANEYCVLADRVFNCSSNLTDILAWSFSVTVEAYSNSAEKWCGETSNISFWKYITASPTKSPTIKPSPYPSIYPTITPSPYPTLIPMRIGSSAGPFGFFSDLSIMMRLLIVFAFLLLLFCVFYACVQRRRSKTLGYVNIGGTDSEDDPLQTQRVQYRVQNQEQEADGDKFDEMPGCVMSTRKQRKEERRRRRREVDDTRPRSDRSGSREAPRTELGSNGRPPKRKANSIPINNSASQLELQKSWVRESDSQWKFKRDRSPPGSHRRRPPNLTGPLNRGSPRHSQTGASHSRWSSKERRKRSPQVGPSSLRDHDQPSMRRSRQSSKRPSSRKGRERPRSLQSRDRPSSRLDRPRSLQSREHHSSQRRNRLRSNLGRSERDDRERRHTETDDDGWKPSQPQPPTDAGPEKPPPKHRVTPSLRVMFNSMDVHGSGYVLPNDFIAFMGEKFDCSERDALALFRDIDYNISDQISMEKLRRWLQINDQSFEDEGPDLYEVVKQWRERKRAKGM